MANREETYTDLVQLHERSWGTESYPGRPSLADLLNKPIVAMWMPVDGFGKEQFMFTAHDTAAELHELITELVTVGKVAKMNRRKLSRLFINKKPVKFSVKLALDKLNITEQIE